MVWREVDAPGCEDSIARWLKSGEQDMTPITAGLEARVAKFFGKSYFLVLLLLLVVWNLAGTTFHGAIGGGGWDFPCFYEAAQRFRLHQPIYREVSAGAPYVYLPLLAILLAPVSLLSMATAYKVWTAINIILLFGSVAIYSRMRNWSLTSAVPICIACFIAFRNEPMTLSFAAGQSNVLLLIVTIAMMQAYTGGKSATLCSCILIGFMFKFWLLGWIGFLLLKRMWKEALVCLLGATVLVAVSFSTVGWGQFRAFYTLVRILGSGSGDNGQDLFTFARSHFVQSDIVRPWANSPPLAGVVIVVGIAIAAYYLTPLLSADHVTDPRGRRLEFGLFNLVFMLLLPGCQDYYLILAVPIFWELVLPDNPTSRASVTAVLGFAIYCLFLRNYIDLSRPPHYSAGLGALKLHIPLCLMALLALVARKALLQCGAIVIRDSNGSKAPNLGTNSI